MNPGISTSPVKGDVLEQAVALRALGWQWDQIAAELRKRTGIERITGPMVGAVVRRQAKEALSRPSFSKGLSTNADAASDADAAQAVKDGKIGFADPKPKVCAPVGASVESSEYHHQQGSDLQAPAIQTSKTSAGNFLVISDLQVPFGHPKALVFCQQVRRDYNIPLSNILCVGDEIDQWWASRFEPKDPDAKYTPNQEIDAAIAELMRWYQAFPDVRICESNHGGRWAKRAARGGIPARMRRDYRDVIGAPAGWRWAEYWIVDGGRLKFRIEHGHRSPKGHSGLRTRPLWRGISVAWGHEHKEPGTLHIESDDGRELWSMRVGSLMDTAANEANEYATEQAGRPALSVGVVLDGGRLPLVVRMG